MTTSGRQNMTEKPSTLPAHLQLLFPNIKRKHLKRAGIGIAPQERREFEWLLGKVLKAMQKAETKDLSHPPIAKELKKLKNWSEAHPESWEFLAQKAMEAMKEATNKSAREEE